MKCDGCTLCCKLINIPWMDSPPGKWCKHCIIGKGCNVWNTVCPNDCKIYECSYRQSKCSTDIRPDKIKILFEKIAPEIFLGINDPDYKLTSLAKKQIMSFVKHGFSVVVSNYKNTEPQLFLAKDHNANQIIEEVKRLRKAHDNSILYN